MDITRILNPTDVLSETVKPSNHIEIWDNTGDTKSNPPINESLLFRNNDLANYQDKLADLAKECQRRLEHMRSQLPSTPLHRRNLTYKYPYRHSQSFPKAKPRRFYGNGNKAYTAEQLDFIRYHRDDLGLEWEPLFIHFKKVFPGRSCETYQGLSAKYYRANKFVQYNENSTVMRDKEGKILYLSAKVRERKEEGLPYGLVQRYPQRGLKYTWVREEHKEEMRQLALEMDDDTRGIL